MRSLSCWSPSSGDAKRPRRIPPERIPGPRPGWLGVAALTLLAAGGTGVDLCAAPAASVMAQDTTAQDSLRRELIRERDGLRPTPRDARMAEEGAARRARPGAAARDSLAREGDPFPEPDSIMRILMGRAGYRPVFYQGDTLQFTPGDRSLRIQQRALLERLGDRLYADSVIYRSNTRYLTAYGQSTLINAEGEEVTSDQGPFFYNTDRKLGTVVDGRTRWDVWDVQGNFTLEGSDTLWVKGGRFTSCEDPVPHYHFAADRIKLILGNIVVAWPVRLYFGKVPVFWFPFFAQDVRRGRHSGILTPRFGINDIVRQDRGHNRHISNVGYYWAISDYMDAQLGFDWWSDVWFRIDGFYRYRWRRKFLDGRLGYSQFFLPDGGRETSLVWNHSQKFGERADLRASVQFVSSVQFERENEFNPERLTQQLRSDVSFNRRFDWGTLAIGAQRVQPLSEGEQTTLDLPQLSLTFNSLPITRAPSPAQKRWYHGLALTGSSLRFNRQDIDNPDRPDRTTINAQSSTGLTLGSLRWGGSASYRETTEDVPDTLITSIDTMIVNGDTITADTSVIGPNVKEGTLRWSNNLGYRIPLIGSTTLTPSVSIDGSLFRSNETNQDFVSAPTRVSANARLTSDLFGFFPGLGSVQRIRHKISPSISWSYSPAVTPSQRLLDLRGFSVSEVQERHTLSLTLNQTFEAKLRPPRVESDEESDTQPEGRKLTILSLQTSPLSYDLVSGRLVTETVRNRASSDLLRGFRIEFVHDLFEQTEDGRVFDLFLQQVNLGFALGQGTIEGLFGGPGAGVARDRGIRPQIQEFEDELIEEEEMTEEPEEREGPRRRPWTLNVDYSLIRQRGDTGLGSGETRQTIRWNLGFSPTDNWTVSWRTQFDIEEGEFVDQVVSLRRDLHRWSATFDFLKAANDNFTFEFRVNLNDLPDLKFDYRQETRR